MARGYFTQFRPSTCHSFFGGKCERRASEKNRTKEIVEGTARWPIVYNVLRCGGFSGSMKEFLVLYISQLKVVHIALNPVISENVSALLPVCKLI